MASIFIKKNHNELCSINFILPIGQVHDPIHKVGLTHLIEHLIFHSHPRMKQEDLMMKIEEMGGIFNAITEKEMTIVYGRIHKRYINQVINYFAESIHNLEKSLDCFPVEKQVLIRELSFTPQQSAYKSMMYHHENQLFNGHPYGINQFKENNVDTITEGDFLAFLDQYNWSSWSVLIVGDIEIDEISETNLKLFDNKESSKGRFTPKVNLKKNQKVDYYDLDVNGVICSLPTMSMFSTIESLVFYNGFFTGISNPFYSSLVAENGFTYQIESNFLNYRQYKGIQMGWLTSPKDVSKSVDHMMFSLDKLHSNPDWIVKLIRIGIEKSRSELLLIQENFIRYSSHLAKQCFIHFDRHPLEMDTEEFAHNLTTKIKNFIERSFFVGVYH